MQDVMRRPIDRWMRIGLWLVGATMAYNILEAIIALYAGTAADRR